MNGAIRAQGTPLARECEIPRVLSDLEETIVGLDTSLGGLFERIRPVIANRPNATAEGAATAYASELAIRINGYVDNLKAITARVQNYRQDCEL